MSVGHGRDKRRSQTMSTRALKTVRLITVDPQRAYNYLIKTGIAIAVNCVYITLVLSITTVRVCLHENGTIRTLFEISVQYGCRIASCPGRGYQRETRIFVDDPVTLYAQFHLVGIEILILIASVGSIVRTAARTRFASVYGLVRFAHAIHVPRAILIIIIFFSWTRTQGGNGGGGEADVTIL